jgi:hypothetical protein
LIEGERVKSDSQSVSQSCPTMGKMHCIAWHGDGMEWNGMEWNGMEWNEAATTHKTDRHTDTWVKRGASV